MTAGFRALLIAALLGSSPTDAHDTWLEPQPGPGDLVVRLKTGPHYPAGTSSSSPQDMTEAAARIAGRKVSPRRAWEAAGVLHVSFPAPQAGVATVWVTLAEALVELNDEQVAAYLDDASAPDYVRRAWADAGAGRRWREGFTKLAKVVVSVGAANADDSWRAPVGQRLEIVPESDPRTLRVGATLRAQVLQEGRPLPGLVVSCVDPQGRVGHKRATDAAGRLSCPLTRPGAWLVRGIELRRARTGGADWESLWATLMVQVRP